MRLQSWVRNFMSKNLKLRKPRTNRHSNIPDEKNAEQYFRIFTYDEFLSRVIADLNEWFIDDLPACIGLSHLLPSKSLEAAEHVIPPELAKSINFYEEAIPHMSMGSTEYTHTVCLRQGQKHSDREEAPKKLIEAFHQCSSIAILNIQILLHLALTVPIISC